MELRMRQNFVGTAGGMGWEVRGKHRRAGLPGRKSRRRRRWLRPINYAERKVLGQKLGDGTLGKKRNCGLNYLPKSFSCAQNKLALAGWMHFEVANFWNKNW